MNKSSSESKLYGLNFTPKMTESTEKKKKKIPRNLSPPKCFGAYFILLYARAF